MAKPERLPGGFELANGRAADRVSEKEAEAGRSRRRGRTASAAASPWHSPGLRLQRLHKAAFLGAAVSLLVRGRREAGPRPLRVGEGRPPWGSLGPAAHTPRPTHPGRPPPARLSRSGQNLDEPTPRRPAHRRGPSPANGRASPHLATPAGRSATSSSAALRQGFALLSMGRNGVPLARWWVVVLPLSADGDWALTLFCPGPWAPHPHPRPPRPPWSASARRLFGPGSS